MRLFSLLVVSLFFCGVLLSQTRPNLFPDQIETPNTLEVPNFCKPGIKNKSRSRGLEISYNYMNGSTFREETEVSIPNNTATTNALTNTLFKVKIPILNRPGFKFLLGYNRERENYRFDDLGDRHRLFYETLDQYVFKSNNYSLLFSKSLDEKRYLGLNARLLYNGNYEGWASFDKLYQHFSLIGIYGQKSNEDFEWGIGISYSYNLEKKNRLVPFFIYNKNFSNHWGIEAILPISLQLRYNPNPNNIFLFGFNYASQSYAMNNIIDNATNIFVLNHAEVRGSISWEAKLMPWIWVNLKTGYQYNFDTELLDQNSTQENIIYDPTNALFFRIGIFVSPPRSYMK